MPTVGVRSLRTGQIEPSSFPEARLVTISIDDGHPGDLRVANMLARWGLKGTFYVARSAEGRALLSASEIRDIGCEFEIGAHTLSHQQLTRLSDEAAWEEIAGGKRWLEDVTGVTASSFCYPRGKVSRRISAMVRRAGFRGARTCMLNLHSWPSDPFYWGASTQAHSHSRLTQLQHAIVEGNFRGASNFALVHNLADDWLVHFEKTLEWVDTHGGIAHLFLHSWEIDQQGDWERLDQALRSVAERHRLNPVTNGELFELWWRA
jgi:peptidoglycan/xylan/chitin deacetylase (PgdA/CDA1 family)